MSKKKLKAEIKKLKAQVLEARTSAVASNIAKMILLSSGGVIEVPKKPEPDEPAIIGTLRRMAEAAAAKGTPEL